MLWGIGRFDQDVERPLQELDLTLRAVADVLQQAVLLQGGDGGAQAAALLAVTPGSAGCGYRHEVLADAVPKLSSATDGSLQGQERVIDAAPVAGGTLGG